MGQTAFFLAVTARGVVPAMRKIFSCALASKTASWKISYGKMLLSYFLFLYNEELHKNRRMPNRQNGILFLCAENHSLGEWFGKRLVSIMKK